LEIFQFNLYNSPNIYSLNKSIIRMRVKLGKQAETPTKNIKNFNTSIIKLFPGLVDHKCALGYKGGFIERLTEGTYMAHVAEHLCLELQTMLGYKAFHGKARLVQGDMYDIIFECKHLIIGKECGIFIVGLINSLINETEFSFPEQFERLKDFSLKYEPGPSSTAIIKEAENRGIPVSEFPDSGILRLGYGRYQKYLSSTIYENTSCISVDISCDKSLTKFILSEEQLPVTMGNTCNTLDAALSEAHRIGYPIVVKPRHGNHGSHVFIDINSDEEVEEAFLQVIDFKKEVIVEKFIRGQDYRLLIINGKMAAAAQRVPANIIGDGRSSIGELIEVENLNSLRGEDHEKPLTKIKVDNHTHKLLKSMDLKIHSVPEMNQRVLLKRTANLSTGGTAIDCTDIVHPKNKEIAETAARLIGLDIAGVDMVIPDIENPIAEDYGAIIEVNAAPGIRMHLHPSSGADRNVAASILDMIFPENASHSIPIVSVTGTNGKTTTTRMISHILMQKGLKVGKTTTDGIYINNECIHKVDASGPVSARRILNNKEIDAAVLETARGGMLREGLAYHQADVAVFTNLSEDHLGVDGVNSLEELLNIKSLVVEAVKEKGSCILNADDEWVMKVRNKAKGSIVLFSTDTNNHHIRKHLAAGGRAVYQLNKSIYYEYKNTQTEIISLKDIPSTYLGKLRHNVYNSMAAVGACLALGIPLDIIRDALKTFRADQISNPGRFNVFDLNKFKVILDYGHNIEGYKATIEGIKALNPTRMVGVIGMPGDREDGHIKKVAEIAAKSFDYILIKEDNDLRGRKPLEVANIMFNRAIECGMSKENLRIVPNEADALRIALKSAKKGDIITAFFEKMGIMVKTLDAYRQNHMLH